MSIEKSDNLTAKLKLADVNREIKVIASLVAEVLVEEFGDEFFEKLTIANKTLDNYNNEKNFKNIQTAIDNFRKFNPYWLIRLIRAYTLYFHVANVVEHIYRIDNFALEEYSIELLDLKLKNILKNNYQENHKLLNNLDIKFVFTAHPTESTKPEILNKINELHEIIKKRYEERKQGVPFSDLSFQSEIKEFAKIIIQTDELRQFKPTPYDEAINNLYYIDRMVFQEIPKLNLFIRELLEINKPDESPSPIKFGTWVGGDRDGNPNVDHSTTNDIIELQHDRNKEIVIREIKSLISNLSQSIHIATFSKPLLKFINKNKNLIIDKNNFTRYDEEPYRQALLIILDKYPNKSYDHDDLISDLRIVLVSLIENRGTNKEIKKLMFLIEAIKIGGLTTAHMDIREDSAITTGAAKEIISILYDKNLSISQALDIIEKNEKIINSSDISTETLEVIKTFNVVKNIREKYGYESINTWIVAMTSTSDDLLAIAFLGLYTKLFSSKKEISDFRIVPLLETINDLKNSEKVLSEFWQKIYSNNNVVEVMIGYSDSNKDGGIIKSQWDLFRAQKTIYKLSKKFNLDLVLFHGRGGSSSRGGGPSGEAILSQPLETVNGKIKITKQGEVISDNFANSDLAETNLKIILNAMLEASIKEPSISQKDEAWFETMNYLSDESYRCYKNFISNNDIFDYLKNATPLEELQNMNIGSRPSKRRGGLRGIKDLRAIPWVFSWTQSRQIVPGWYGFGTSIEKAINKGRKEDILSMYKNMKFFRNLVSNIEMNLVKTDLIISKAYVENLYPSGMQVFEQIEEEYNKSKKYLLMITGDKELMESNVTLKETLNIRESYILPINIFQIILLAKLRSESDDNNLIKRSLLLTINGISAGLKNTG